MSEDSAPEKAPLNEQAGSSPIPGCIILATVLVMFGGLALLYTFVFRAQQKEVAAFTDAQAVERTIIEPSAEQIRIADTKIATLQKLVKENAMEQVFITAEDLNVWISTRELLSDFRGTTFISGISERGIAAQMSQAMRKRLLSDERQYLNATFYLKPVAKGGSVIFNVVDIEPDSGKPMDPGFIDAYSKLDFFRLDTSNTDLEPVLSQIGSVTLEGDKIVVATRIDMERVKAEQ